MKTKERKVIQFKEGFGPVKALEGCVLKINGKEELVIAETDHAIETLRKEKTIAKYTSYLLKYTTYNRQDLYRGKINILRKERRSLDKNSERRLEGVGL